MDFGDSQMGDIPTRPMRVKVLYTFDRDNKTNCLARFPDILQIPAVEIDESSQVGVIELKQCLQAIISASPELISRLGDGDFTIYAYDYSEYDTPLVGQGMLSTTLAATSPTQQNKTMITGRVCKNMLALFSNGVKETLEVKLRLVPVPKPVQNEFTKSMESFRSMSPAVSAGFDPNAWNASMQQNKSQQQTNDYFNFDALASGNDRDMALVDDIFSLGSASSGSGSGQQMAGGVGVAETPTDPNFGFNPAFAAHAHSAPGSRAGSPMMGPESSIHNEALRHMSFSAHPSNFAADQSRPASRTSLASEVQSSTHQRQASMPSIPQQQTAQLQDEVHYNEDGQARKRAKVTQTDWRGRSSFGSRSSDLRVTAATAASLQMHRPIPKRPMAPGSNLEPPPRVPTPVPRMNSMLAQQQQAQQPNPRRSLLRQASTADSDFLSDIENFSDTLMSSPEEDSPDNSITADASPREIPSSPPVFSGINQPQPSSPGLPTLPPPRIADSGYMSERAFTSSNVIESLENDEERSPDAQDYAMAAHFRPRGQQSHPIVKIEGSITARLPTYASGQAANQMNVEMEMPGDMNQLPQKILVNLPPGHPSRREGSQGPPKPSKPSVARRLTKTDKSATSPTSEAPSAAFAPLPAAIPTPVPAPPSEPPQSRRGSLALPPNPIAPSSDQAQPPDQSASQGPAPRKRQSMQRSWTSSNDSEAGSPAPSDTEGGGRPKGPNRSGSSAHRRKLIEQRLQNSIAKGEMPQFCSHCGAIETPTWRKLYVKECTGKPSPLDSVEGEGEQIGVENAEINEDTGEVTKFVIRKSMKKTKDNTPGPGFKEVLVCNPCGLWFNKFRNMRPSDKWNRKSGTRKSKKQKSTEPGMSTDGLEPQSDAFFTDQVAPEDAVDDAEVYGDGRMDAEAVVRTESMAPPAMRPRANSMQAQQSRRVSEQGEWTASQLDAALARAVQSSPVQGCFQGSQESPIEIDDLTPRPTRRLLFPSPRRDGEVKSLDDNGQVSLKSTPPSTKSVGKQFFLTGKPGLEFDQASSNIFEAFTSFDKENMAPPLNMDDNDLAHLFEGGPSALFKTPRKTPLRSASKTTPRSLRHLMKTPTPGSRKRKPLSPNANAANGANVNDFMTSPSSSRYFLRSTPSRLERTPGRHSSQRSNGTGDGVSPWSRHLAQMLSDANDTTAFTSPSRQIDFSDLPTFTTPGRSLQDCDWEGLEGLLSSEFAAYEETTYLQEESGDGVVSTDAVARGEGQAER